ncbi:MAG TPA: glycolate oxidase subunit GlcE [Thiobacillaceae bacterium]|nr:glycolate oxidase subunit GlcE [Thiobacillaceae bacterium]
MLAELSDRIRAAHAAKTPLRIRGGGSKDWYGGPLSGEILDVSVHRGIVSYEPGELVLTAKSGTPLAEIEDLLEQHGQMLAFEPPHFGATATLGGALACAFAGPRRAYAGSARDMVLGTRLIDGRGQTLTFGGQVMKNVAGYDVSRLMVGALGTLGVILEASLKVLPKPFTELTLRFEMDEADAILKMNQWSALPFPLSASAWVGGALMLRLSGAQTAVRAAHEKLGGEVHEHGAQFWRAAREQSAAFFSANDLPLWRLSVPAACPPLALPGRQALTWGGAQRWLKSDAAPNVIRSIVATAGGHATLFRGGDKSAGVFHPLPESLMKYHRRLKARFDPAGILNRGRFYRDF